MKTNLEPKATKDVVRNHKPLLAAEIGPVVTRKSDIAQDLPDDGRSRRGDEAGPLSRPLHPPSDVDGYQVCEQLGSKRVPFQLVGAAMFSPAAWELVAQRLRLSGRELEIVRGVFDDHKETAIASDLRVSVHTIHTHFGRLHRKLGITDRAQLLLRIMQEFLALTTARRHGRPLAWATPEAIAVPCAADG